jgi:hypothetical protein
MIAGLPSSVQIRSPVSESLQVSEPSMLAPGGVRCVHLLAGLALGSAPMIAADQAAEDLGRDS